ncbi:MAG: hypothetical protein U0324_11150 [Polyangiales bacterium]
MRLRAGAGGDVDAVIEAASPSRMKAVLDAWPTRLFLQGEPDSDWYDPDAGKERNLRYPGEGIEHVYLVAGGEVQGLLITSLPAVTRAPSEPLVAYIEYIAAAPWNRPSSGEAPRYRGVGKALVQHAVARSATEGREGCLGLNFLGDRAWAEGFMGGERSAP